jgi:hypothetical protein
MILMAAVATVWAQAPPPPMPAAPQSVSPVISSRQIDRYDAMRALQERVKVNPKSLADWIILGELAQEVALDLPADQATGYYKLSRDAYERALALRPDQPGLKAAVQFARDRDANAQRFEEVRDRATKAYLEARRRDLAAAQYTPSIPLYPAPLGPVTSAIPVAAVPAGVVQPPDVRVDAVERNAAATVVRADPDAAISPAPRAQADVANLGTRQFYSPTFPTYEAYYAQGVPYTYQQYTSAYYPAGVARTTAPPPITVQRYWQLQPEYPGRQSVNRIR